MCGTHKELERKCFNKAKAVKFQALGFARRKIVVDIRVTLTAKFNMSPENMSSDASRSSFARTQNDSFSSVDRFILNTKPTRFIFTHGISSTQNPQGLSLTAKHKSPPNHIYTFYLNYTANQGILSLPPLPPPSFPRLALMLQKIPTSMLSSVRFNSTL